MLCLTRLRASVSKVAFLEMVKDLRFRTEAPISDCSAALKETQGDVEKAMEVLRKKGSARAMKKQSRVTQHGSVVACVGGTFGAAVITVCSETDFAARSAQFQNTCAKVRDALQKRILDSKGDVLANPTEAHHLLVEATTEDIQASIAILGENVMIKSVEPLRLAPHVAEHISIGSYTHGSLEVLDVGRIAGVVAVSRLDPTMEVGTSTLTDVSRHFVACSGAEGNYAHQNFFGTEETVGQWLKRHGLRFSSSLVVDFGKEPVIHTAPQPRTKAR
ncbi:putative elongation factor ts [Trypanosoma rangeli]|uniref:Elongation factor Ts, mitochondrial n=1 Tax=Trypanosoma rangeli TaxID=5698 RepID=A0A3R7MU30_TRYRA|nr:putative elongation factor ts [Trypanosoma rangeli]RNF08142.1 putative elongation factor ts [Trypanosoma rangeli]|eukprot:RNF08142.1 putative elongation factor ts [Trypanosoma rangeli]